MKVSELVKSKEYLNAKAKIRSWKERLNRASEPEVMRIRDEKAAFFSQMREQNPQLYTALEILDKELSEMIFKRITGEDVIID